MKIPAIIAVAAGAIAFASAADAKDPLLFADGFNYPACSAPTSPWTSTELMTGCPGDPNTIPFGLGLGRGGDGGNATRSISEIPEGYFAVNMWFYTPSNGQNVPTVGMTSTGGNGPGFEYVYQAATPEPNLVLNFFGCSNDAIGSATIEPLTEYQIVVAFDCQGEGANAVDVYINNVEQSTSATSTGGVEFTGFQAGSQSIGPAPPYEAVLFAAAAYSGAYTPPTPGVGYGQAYQMAASTLRAGHRAGRAAR